jgi:hypothetical protein
MHELRQGELTLKCAYAENVLPFCKGPPIFPSLFAEKAADEIRRREEARAIISEASAVRREEREGER